MPFALHFPFRFDVAWLRADLATAQTVEWQPHYNEQDYGGGWSGIALRSAGGDTSQLIAKPAEISVFADTPLLKRGPYFQQVLAVFQCPLKAVRLLSLAPQSFIREHSDHALGYDDGEIRIHIPIHTNPDVEFYVAGERLLLEEGHSYFVNVNLPHRVNNRGQTARIHLVIDAEVNEWVRALFRQGAAEHWDVARCPLPPRNVDDFRRHVLASPALQPPLQAIASPAQFSGAVMELGRSLGFDFHDGDVGAALRCGPLAWQADSCGPSPAIELRCGWTPVRVAVREGCPIAEWVYTGARRFTEPFFEESVRTALRKPFARFFRCEMPLEIANETGFRDQTMEPSGLIFHMSRCGSTLISQMLAVLPRHLVISEAPPVDEVIQAKEVQWIRSIVRALGQRPSGEETSYFLKMDAWHTHSLPLIRAAFPTTPWIFVYRDPLEVMVSQLSRPGKLSIQGAMDPAILGLEKDDITELSREEWCARVLAGILKSALAARRDPLALCIHYRELPEAVFGAIARHFGMSLNKEKDAGMRGVTAFDAKNPAMWFTSDSAAKRAGASPKVRELCDALLKDMYGELMEWERETAGVVGVAT